MVLRPMAQSMAPTMIRLVFLRINIQTVIMAWGPFFVSVIGHCLPLILPKIWLHSITWRGYSDLSDLKLLYGRFPTLGEVPGVLLVIDGSILLSYRWSHINLVRWSRYYVWRCKIHDNCGDNSVRGKLQPVIRMPGPSWSLSSILLVGAVSGGRILVDCIKQVANAMPKISN